MSRGVSDRVLKSAINRDWFKRRCTRCFSIIRVVFISRGHSAHDRFRTSVFRCRCHLDQEIGVLMLQGTNSQTTLERRKGTMWITIKVSILQTSVRWTFAPMFVGCHSLFARILKSKEPVELDETLTLKRDAFI